MRIEVDGDKCECHGLCEQGAPSVYQLDDEGELVLVNMKGVPVHLHAQAQAGARSCPVAALLVRS
jgi:ferredoxin